MCAGQTLRDNLSSSRQVSANSPWRARLAARRAALLLAGATGTRRVRWTAAPLAELRGTAGRTPGLVRVRDVHRQAGVDPGVETAEKRTDAREPVLPELRGHPGRRRLVRSGAVEDQLAAA